MRCSNNKIHPLYDSAIESYSQVIENINGIAKLFPFENTPDEEKNAHVKDKERCIKAIEYFRAAMSAEAIGLKYLAEIVKRL